jgi:hypothetical protein
LCFIAGFALAFGAGRIVIPDVARKWRISQVLKHVNLGSIKILWSTYQILATVSATLNVSFPSPFKNLLQAMALTLSLFNLSLLSCVIKNMNYFTQVLSSSLVPLAVSFVVAGIGLVRWSKCRALDNTAGMKKVQRQHLFGINFFLFLCLPVVIEKLLESLQCDSIGSAASRFVSENTSIDCNTKEYAKFRVFASLALVAYLSVPVVWGVLLCINVKKNGDPYFRSKKDKRKSSLSFLYTNYKERCWGTEVLETFRRIIFVGAIPFVAKRDDKRGGIGIMLALISIIMYREKQPYRKKIMNSIIVSAQYTILLTFIAAVAILTDMNRGLSDLVFGTLMFFINVAVLGLVLYLAYRNYKKEINSFITRTVLLPLGMTWYVQLITGCAFV